MYSFASVGDAGSSALFMGAMNVPSNTVATDTSQGGDLAAQSGGQFAQNGMMGRFGNPSQNQHPQAPQKFLTPAQLVNRLIF